MKRFFIVNEADDEKWKTWPGSIRLWAREKCFHQGYDYYVIGSDDSKKPSFERGDIAVAKDGTSEWYFNNARSLEYSRRIGEDKHFVYYESLPENDEDQKIVFVTLCDSESVDRADVLKKSLHGELIILDTYDHSIGNFSKLTKFHDFLKSYDGKSDDDIICFIDAFDMLCVNFDKGAIIDAFESYGKDIIFGSEENCGPEHPKFVKEYFDGKAERNFLSIQDAGCYLNGGFQIGYKRAFLEMHEYISENFETLKSNLEIERNTEQGIISQVFVSEKFNTGLDYERKIVNNVAPYRETITDIPSFFIHVIRADTFAKTLDIPPMLEDNYEKLYGYVYKPYLEGKEEYNDIVSTYFKITPELNDMYQKFLRGEIKYNKHVDMMIHKFRFFRQTQKYREIVRHFTDFDRLNKFSNPRLLG